MVANLNNYKPCVHIETKAFSQEGIVIQTIVIQICCHTAHQCILVFFFFLAFPLTTLDIFRYFAYNALLTLC